MTFLWGLPSSDYTFPYFSLLLGWYGESYGRKMDWEPVQKGQWKERKICSLKNKAASGKHILSLDPDIHPELAQVMLLAVWSTVGKE